METLALVGVIGGGLGAAVILARVGIGLALAIMPAKKPIANQD